MLILGSSPEPNAHGEPFISQGCSYLMHFIFLKNFFYKKTHEKTTATKKSKLIELERNIFYGERKFKQMAIVLVFGR